MVGSIRGIELLDNSALVAFGDGIVEVKFPIGAPPRFQEIWPWIKALDAYDYGRPRMFSDILSSTLEIPEEIRPALADIVSGLRKPNKKAAAKLKLDPEKRMDYAAAIHGMQWSFETIKHDKVEVDEVITSVISRYAEQAGTEAIQEVRRVVDLYRENKEMWVKVLGVSEETIENLVRDLRRKIAQFPIV